jgi:hypothetical protein
VLGKGCKFSIERQKTNSQPVAGFGRLLAGSLYTGLMLMTGSKTLKNIEWFLSLSRDLILDAHDLISSEDFSLLYRQIRPYTMCGNARLRQLYLAVHYVYAHNVIGDVVECGTARGGSACLMGLTLKQLHARRLLWVFDTFEGIPAPTKDDPDFEIAKLYTGSFRGSLDEVNRLFQSHDISGQCRLIKGRFQETLPGCNIQKIALLHIDGDWYESVKTCLDHLYDRVSPGGIIQIDDYGHWKGARKAVDEFLGKRSINPHLRWVDYTGRQMIKPDAN